MMAVHRRSALDRWYLSAIAYRSLPPILHYIPFIALLLLHIPCAGNYRSVDQRIFRQSVVERYYHYLITPDSIRDYKR